MCECSIQTSPFPVARAKAVTKIPQSLTYVKGPNIRWGEGVVVLVLWVSERSRASTDEICARELSLCDGIRAFVTHQATWCDFCKKSLQPLDSIVRRYTERGA